MKGANIELLLGACEFPLSCAAVSFTTAIVGLYLGMDASDIPVNGGNCAIHSTGFLYGL